ncbi:MAG: hypothetical protein RLZZ306_819 [Bacteroidota bacterium]
MFHEIIKHTRKIKDKMDDKKDEKKDSSERWKEIITELLIIIFAVSLTTWFHDLNEHRSQQKEVKEFLVDLRDDLSKDIKGLETQKVAIIALMNRFKFARSLDKRQVDSLNRLNPKYQLTNEFRLFFGEENNGNYEGFESSGKTVFIENKKLKKLILLYYKHHIPATEKTGEIFSLSYSKISDFIIKNITVEKNNNAVLLNSDFQTNLEINMIHAQENIRIGDIGIKNIREIIAEIDLELKE